MNIFRLTVVEINALALLLSIDQAELAPFLGTGLVLSDEQIRDGVSSLAARDIVQLGENEFSVRESIAAFMGSVRKSSDVVAVALNSPTGTAVFVLMDSGFARWAALPLGYECVEVQELERQTDLASQAAELAVSLARDSTFDGAIITQRIEGVSTTRFFHLNATGMQDHATGSTTSIREAFNSAV